MSVGTFVGSPGVSCVNLVQVSKSRKIVLNPDGREAWPTSAVNARVYA